MNDFPPSPEIGLYQPSDTELLQFARNNVGCNGGVLRFLSEGHQNKAFVFMPPNEKALVLRYPKRNARPDELKAEYDLFVRLNGCRFPQAIDHSSIGGTPVALIEFIDGSHKDFNDLSVDEIQELARAMADVHAHTSDSYSARSGADPIQSGTHRDYLLTMIQESVSDRLELLQRKDVLVEYDSALTLVDKGLSKLRGILDAYPEDFSGKTFSLLHHDINPGNVLWGNGGRVTFIDPNPTYGDPCDDINYVVSNNNGSLVLQQTLIRFYGEITGDNITDARMEAYTLKNWLDDLLWAMEMCENHKEDGLYDNYCSAYMRRYEALQKLLFSDQSS